MGTTQSKTVLDAVKVVCRDECFDHPFDFDFRSLTDAEIRHMRGNVKYCRPIGSMRYALKVLKKYDNGTDDWLTDNVNGWINAYHGTRPGNVQGIVDIDFDPKRHCRQQYGPGHYVSPDPRTAFDYSHPFKLGETTFRAIVQVRVRPGSFHCITPDAKLSPCASHQYYWRVENKNDLRPYAICIYVDDGTPPHYEVAHCNFNPVKWSGDCETCRLTCAIF